MSALQVNGHLDYMRQMDTILVAVGIPTKEVPGASFALPQAEAIPKGTVDTPDQTPSEHQENGTQSPTEEGETCAENGDATGDGWDIPDISDLLDSLNDSGSQIGARTSLPLAPEERTAEDDAACARGRPGEGVEEADPDDEHVSWSWEDTKWTVEHAHTQTHTDKQRQPNL